MPVTRGPQMVITFRLVLTGVLLLVAPAAALTHLLVHWTATRVAVNGARADVERNTQAIEAAQARIAAVRSQQAAVDLTRAERGDAMPWLARRDRDGVFDQIAGAFCDPHVSVGRLMLDEPGLFAAASRTNLLACERAVVECRGSYGALAQCLDRLVGQSLPLRVDRLAWTANGAQLLLSAQIEVPFVPNDALRAQLADGAKLMESDEPHAP